MIAGGRRATPRAAGGRFVGRKLLLHGRNRHGNGRDVRPGAEAGMAVLRAEPESRPHWGLTPTGVGRFEGLDLAGSRRGEDEARALCQKRRYQPSQRPQPAQRRQQEKLAERVAERRVECRSGQGRRTASNIF